MSNKEIPDKENKKQSFIDWLASPQMIVSFSAMVLSICGLFVSIYETSLMSEQQKIMKEEQYASVWPNVELGPSIDGSNESLEIVIRNTGVGPAIIKGAVLIHNDEVIPNWPTLLQSLTKIENYSSGRVRLVGGSVLPPQDDEDFIYSLQAESKTEKQLFKDMRKEIFGGRLDIKVCYCSVYDQCWTSSMQNRLNRYSGKDSLSKEDLRVESCSTFSSSGI